MTHPTDVPKRSWTSRLFGSGKTPSAAAAPRRYAVRLLGSLAAPSGFPHLASSNSGNDGLVALWVRSEEDAGKPGGEGVLTAYDRESLAPTRTVAMASLPVAYPFVATMPGGGWLLAGVGADGEDRAFVLTADGDVAHRASIADTPELVLTDRDGDIWVVGSRSGPTLTRWSPELALRWSIAPDVPGAQGMTSLTLAAGEAWALPGGSAHLLRIGRGALGHTTVVPGIPTDALGVIIRDDWVGLLDAGSVQDTAVIGRMVDGRFVESHRVVLRHPDGDPLPSCPIYCLADTAVFIDDADVYAVSLGELLDGAGSASDAPRT